MRHDDLEGRLRAFFAPQSAPPGMARRILAAARDAAAGPAAPARLAPEFRIDASERGLLCLHPAGRVNRRLPGAVRAARRDATTGGATARARRLAERGQRELAEYLAGERSFFTVPADLSALPRFQRDVLRETARIPFGETRTYAWVARRIGRPRAVRAVGTALGRNPVPVVIPCHRVLRSDGGYGGYAFGVPLKKRLLRLEASTAVLQGCASTRIVCRVGCHALRRARPDRRVVFASTADARAMGFRPCRVCRPLAA